ncbi:hypothetical protein IT072_03650 [Leifsonia sp. ZF2019]|uniref:hypothetical protein n=1 Tax=Leifsonia sp. ZF2019 TaxID=2781978 RepID=UPI001CBBA1F7|nr:hypothetical protein [Leifsonia sp. ZF2019]UAJ80153.1 hypothetical protein IT072_03650 [Leifsonia sp. ZF2019]
MSYRVDVTTQQHGAEVIEQILTGAATGVNLGAEFLLGLAKARAPFRDGDLVSSGTVQRADDAIDIEADVVFDAPYAARWHEDGPLIDSLGRHYEGSSNFQNGRESHYVENPARENRRQIGAIVRKAAKAGE